MTRLQCSMTNRGFTLIEILFSILILSILVTLVSISFSKFNSSQALRGSANLVVSVVNEARSLTLSSANDVQYGVHFEDSRLVLFRGSAYSPTDPLNVPTSLNSQVGIRNITLSGGGEDVVFRRLSGEATKSGTMELFLRSAPETFRVINISTTGLVEAGT